MSKILKFKSGSQLFHLEPPDGYSRSGEIWQRENDENDYYDKEPDLEIRPKGFHFEIDGQKYLEDYLVKGWFNTFEEILKDRHTDVKIHATLTGTYSPREYNFETDHARFDLEISVDDLQKIQEQVFAHENVFDEYLKECYSRMSGCYSFVPNNIEGWRRHYCGVDITDEDFDPDAKYCYQTCNWWRAVSVLLDFWLLAFPQYMVDGTYANGHENEPPSLQTFEDNIEGFSKEYERHLEYLSSNGAIQDCFELVEDEELEAIPA